MTGRKPILGVLLIGSLRFKPLGDGTINGTYAERKEKEAAKIVDNLDGIAEIIYPGIVYGREKLDEAMSLFYNNKVDVVLALFMSWAEDFAWIRFLRDMYDIPIIFASIVRDECSFTDTSDEDRFIEFLSAGGLVGTLEASGSIKRIDRKMLRSFIGTFQEVMERVVIFSRAGMIRSILKNSVLGLLSSYNEIMWSTYVDPYNFFAAVGPELRFVSVSSLIDEIKLISDAETENAVRIITSKSVVLPDVDKTKLSASVKASLALESLARKLGLDVVVLNDVDPVLLANVGLRPGFTPCPGTDDVIVVPEGDVGGALAVYMLKLLSGKHVNYIEPFYIDRKTGTFAAGHAGPNDYTDPLSDVKIARDIRFAKTSYKYAGAPFAWYTIHPGPKTMVHISECKGRYKLVCTEVDALECPHFLVSYSHGIIKPRVPVQELFGRLIDIGVTQHFALVEGSYCNELEDIAYILDFDYYRI